MGILNIPELALALPIYNRYTMEQLKKTPCRYYGGLDSNDLVVVAHNYSSHFGLLKNLDIGAKAALELDCGLILHYTLQETRVVEPDAVEWVTNGEVPLTLVTCTPGGESRVVLRFGFSHTKNQSHKELKAFMLWAPVL